MSQQISALRQRLIDDMMIHNMSPLTQKVYVRGVTTAGQRDQPAVGNGNAMGVAGKISQHLLGAGEWALGKDHPFASTQRRDILLERGWDFECGEIEELKLARSECRVEILEKQSPEQARHLYIVRRTRNGSVEPYSLLGHFLKRRTCLPLTSRFDD
jgi:hypothetical protein